MIAVVLYGPPTAGKDTVTAALSAVDVRGAPQLVARAEEALGAVEGVRGVGQVRMRWIGHALRAEADIARNEAPRAPAARPGHAVSSLHDSRTA
ncbi:hypothetical protein ACWEP4_20460 [Streptomyces sp. NPDC004227]